MSKFGRKEDIFLRFLGETGRVAHAWRLAGGEPGNLTHMYARKRRDAEFREAWEDAMARAADVFEAEAIRRATDGVTKDVYYKGEVVGHEQVYSDGLMAKILDGSKPEKYALRKENSSINVQVGLAVIPMTAPTLEEWERGAIEHQSSQPMLIEGKAKELPASAALVSKKVVVV